nr:septum formation family protein [Frigoribacterium sp. CFBP 13729]
MASEVVAGSAPGVDPDAVPDTGIEELTVGDCFSFGAADASADQVSMVDLRSCDEDHQNEVFLQDELSGTAAYPGDDETAVEADDLCYGAFEGYVGLPWEESEVDYLYLTPTEESWSEGDHSVLCYVYLYGDTSPGSLQDYGY